MIRTILLRSRTLGVLALPLFAAGVLSGQTVLTLNPAAGELPVSIAFDKGGNAWVSLQNVCQLRQYAPDWHEISRVQFPADCSGGAGASGLAFDSEGQLYAAAIGPDGVRGVYIISRHGEARRLPGTESMAFPNALAFEREDGALFVTDMAAGAIWRIPRRWEHDRDWDEDEWTPSFGLPKLWISGAIFESPVGYGVNGLAIQRGHVIVSVTYPDRIVSIPIREDGRAGTPKILADTAALNAAYVFAIDDITLDIFGNIYGSEIAAVPGVVVISADGKQITHVADAPAAVTSVAFGNRGKNRRALFAVFNQAFGGTGSGVARFDMDVAGQPLP